jgi:hypothetical protein
MTREGGFWFARFNGPEGAGHENPGQPPGNRPGEELGATARLNPEGVKQKNAGEPRRTPDMSRDAAFRKADRDTCRCSPK